MDGRHHRVNREIIFVPVPVAGSPEPLRQAKPPAYKSTRRAPWQPQTRPPSNRKGEAAAPVARYRRERRGG